MRAKQPLLLLHPLFLISVALLLANDFYLKYEYHNWFTGKLSDFTGLFAFTVFIISLLPFSKKTAIAFVALFFCWWKSPLSDPAISLLNDHLNLPVQRVIDYTDLIALLVLPFAGRLREPAYPVFFWRSASVYVLGIISFFSFCATSMPRHLGYNYDRADEVTYYEAFSTNLTEDQILDKLDPLKKGYTRESAKFYRLRRTDNFYYRLRNDSTMTMTPVVNNNDSALLIKIEMSEYFSIPQYVLQADTLYDLAVRIYHNPRKRRKPYTVELVSFRANRFSEYTDFYQSKRRKQYTKHFKALFDQ